MVDEDRWRQVEIIQKYLLTNSCPCISALCYIRMARRSAQLFWVIVTMKGVPNTVLQPFIPSSLHVQRQVTSPYSLETSPFRIASNRQTRQS